MFRRIPKFAMLAAVICLATSIAPAWAQQAGATAAPPPVTSSDQAIKRTLAEKTTLDFPETPLSEAMNYIKDHHKIEVMLDFNALKNASPPIDPSTPITFKIKDITLRSALNLILSQYNLTHIIKDEVLLITSKSQADSMIVTRLYDVRDLAIRDDDPSGSADFDALADIIRITVNPSSWDKSGGTGSLTAFNNNGICALAVWQSYAGQEQIENVLAELRRLKARRPARQ